MKWQLLTLGVSWGILLFKLYQQYRQCKNMYDSQNLQTEKPIQKSQTILYDSGRKQKQQAIQEISPQIVPESALQEQKIEAKCQLQSAQLKKEQISFQTNIDQCDFVVFPELYPHLRKKKNLIRKMTLNKSSNQRNKFISKLKRDTKKYKQWFITNKILTEIQQSGQLSPQQIEQNYGKITKQIKSSCIETQKSISQSGKSEQGTELGNGSIVIRKGESKKMSQNEKVLEFLEEEDGYESNSFKIIKYDPFY